MVTSSQPVGDLFTPSSPQHPNRPSKDLGKIQENTVSASEMPEYILLVLIFFKSIVIYCWIF